MNSTLEPTPLKRQSPQERQKYGMFSTVRSRLYLSFAAITLVLLTAIIVVGVKVNSLQELADTMLEVDIPRHETSLAYTGGIYQLRFLMTNYLLTHNDKYKTEITKLWPTFDGLKAKIDTFKVLETEWSENEKIYYKYWDDVTALLTQLKVQASKLDIPTASDQDRTNIISTAMLPLVNNILDILQGKIDAQGIREGGIFNRTMLEFELDSKETLSMLFAIRVTEYLLFGIIILFSFFTAIHTTRWVMQYINIFRSQSNRISLGDLTQRITINNKDEMGQLGHDLNTMTENLAIITKQITQTCQDMLTNLDEVKASVNTQATGATEQVSSINQITASLEEIEKSSAQTMEKAKNLGGMAEQTRDKGQLGIEAVDQSITGMRLVRDKVQVIAQTILDLSNKTQQVGEITGVVNTLAQQLKMLALNASIEASKAGEAGKGFAVVASEVKNLAEQSEQSTAQVQKILEDIRHATERAVMATEEGTKGVDHGTELVEQTGDVVRNLNEVIHETTIATQQIETSIHQETIGIEQITSGMYEIHQVTSSFVESVKQTTEAIENLTILAHNLKKYVDMYKT